MLKTLSLPRSIRIPEALFNRLGLLTAVSLLLCAMAPGIVAYTVGLYDFAVSSGPYFVPQQALVLYLAVPLVMLGLIISILSPGLFLAARFVSTPTFSTWLLSGFGFSFLLVSFAAGLGEFATQRLFLDRAFIVLLTLINLACYLIAKSDRAERTLAGIAWRKHRHEITAMIALPVVILVFFLPKFFWENLNGDTAHVLFSSKLLLGSMNPYWPETGGPYASDPGFATSLTNYANAWFLRLFGETEFSIRALVLICMPVLFTAFMALIRHGKNQINEARTVLFVALALGLASFVFMYSAAYDPYRADMATPMAREMLLMICYFGFILFYLEKRVWLTALFSTLTVLVVPSGMPLLGFWVAASVVCLRPIPIRMAAITVASVFVCLVVSVLLPIILGAYGQPVPGGEFHSGGIINRLKFVTFHQIHRIAYMLLPVGIVPALSMLWIRHQDRVSMALTLVVLMYFGLFYFQAYRILLHHFIPAILIPVIILWRYDLMQGERHKKTMAAGLTGALALALILSLPSSFRIHTESRAFGQMLHLADTLETKAEEVDRLGQSHQLIELIVPPMQCSSDPYNEFYVAPGTMYYYAQRSERPNPPINFVIRYDEDAGHYELDILDQQLLADLRDRQVPTSTNNWFYFIPRERLFRCHSPGATKGVINLGAVARKVIDRLVPVVQ